MSDLNQSKIEQATSETRVLEVLIEARKPLININICHGFRLRTKGFRASPTTK